jgi:16S rRNA processing protein RimM
VAYSPEAFVTLARILRARGNKGEVAAEILTDFPQRLAKLREVFLSDGRGAPQKAAVHACWLHGNRAIFHFESCDSISAAEKLRGMEIQIPLAERVTLPAGQYFVSDLVGCAVFEIPSAPAAVSSSPCSLATAPALLGTVREVQFTGEGVAGTPLLAVETPQGEVLVPLAEEICTRIDTAARRIEVSLPEGLRELNAGKP